MPIPAQVLQQGKDADEAAEKILQGDTGEGVEATIDPEKPIDAPIEPVEVVKEFKPIMDPTKKLGTPSTIEEALNQIDSLRTIFAQSEHRYSVLFGKYNAEIKPASEAVHQTNQLISTNTALSEQLVEAKAKILELTASQQEVDAGATLKTQAPGMEVNLEGMFTPEVLEQLDDDGVSRETIELIVNKTLAVSQSMMKSMVDPINKGIQDVKKSQVMSAEEKFWGYIDTYVPDNESVNADPRWLAWLGGKISDYADITRRDVLKTAERTSDAVKIVSLFNDFKRSVGLPIVESPRRDIKDVVDPVVPAFGEGLPTGKTYSRAEVKQFYTDQIKGVYKHLPDNGDSIGQDIDKANIEGRIVN